MIRPIALGAGLGLALAVFTAIPRHADLEAAAVPIYRVVGTGDSILHAARSSLASTDRLIDTEQGRNVNAKGLEGRLSSWEAFDDVVLPQSRRGGWIVIQDNALGATDQEWLDFLTHVVAATPDDRCLLGVLPVYHWQWSSGYHNVTKVRAGVMVEVFRRQPCHQFVMWNEAVLANPSLVTDGQHPSPAGVAWLATWIDWHVGGRRS